MGQQSQLKLKVLREKGIDISKLRGFASELKNYSPRMVSVHCINHRLALAAAHAANGIPYIQRFKSILQSLFYFYH
jgi:hypothetical protein